MFTILLIFGICLISYVYLRGLYSLINFRKSLHEGDIVTCKLGYNILVSEVRRIPTEDLVEIRDLHSNNILLVNTNCIYPI